MSNVLFQNKTYKVVIKDIKDDTGDTIPVYAVRNLGTNVDEAEFRIFPAAVDAAIAFERKLEELMSPPPSATPKLPSGGSGASPRSPTVS